MNIIQLLHPKALIDFVYDDSTCRQALEIMGNHGFTAVPVINHEGEYVRTLAEGDLLWFMINKELCGKKELEQYGSLFDGVDLIAVGGCDNDEDITYRHKT